MTHRLLLVLGLLLGACSGDDDDASSGPAPSSTANATEPPGCERSAALEPGFATGSAEAPSPLGFWSGPGADPATGALKEPGAGGYVVATTRLNLRSDAQELFGQHVGAIFAQLARQPGFVASQAGVSGQCGVARTLTVWQDEESMYAFVTSVAHQAAMADTARISRGLSNTTHFPATRAADITWATAAQAIASDDGPFY